MAVRWSLLKLSSARTRWGSAKRDGSIRLHWQLVQLAPELLDYVVVHELAHLHEMNTARVFGPSWRSTAPITKPCAHSSNTIFCKPKHDAARCGRNRAEKYGMKSGIIGRKIYPVFKPPQPERFCFFVFFLSFHGFVYEHHSHHHTRRRKTQGRAAQTQNR